ncbi:MAG: protein kinase [Streptosporangiales bacterium]|nr:protein kinase [Streptosporangiales bacterium]
MVSTAPDRILARRYRLGAELGRGAMGVVHEAYDELLGRDVAVKEVRLPPGTTDEEAAELCERTLREARIAGRLSHPGIVTVYDVVVEHGQPWIIMELVRSRSLDEMVRSQGALPAYYVAEIGLTVLQALVSAHAAGIVHRDVKPSNVLIGFDGRVVLTDFGVAKSDTVTSTTQWGQLLGSPSYIAPERVHGQQGGPESDLWCLGSTLYTAVEGWPPYDRKRWLAMLASPEGAEPAPMTLAGPLRPVLTGLMRRDPADRIAPAEAMRMLRAARSAPLVVRPRRTVPAPSGPQHRAGRGRRRSNSRWW